MNFLEVVDTLNINGVELKNDRALNKVYISDREENRYNDSYGYLTYYDRQSKTIETYMAWTTSAGCDYSKKTEFDIILTDEDLENIKNFYIDKQIKKTDDCWLPTIRDRMIKDLQFCPILIGERVAIKNTFKKKKIEYKKGLKGIITWIGVDQYSRDYGNGESEIINVLFDNGERVNFVSTSNFCKDKKVSKEIIKNEVYKSAEKYINSLTTMSNDRLAKLA